MGIASDPVFRTGLVRTLFVAGSALVVAALPGAGSWPWLAAAVTAFVAAVLVARRSVDDFADLRRRVDELDGSDDDRALEGPAGLASRVAKAHARVEDERSAAELEHAELLGILQATGEGILVLSQGARLVLVNDAAHRFLEPPFEAVGRGLAEVTRNAAILEFAEDVLAGKAPEDREVQLEGARATLWLELYGRRFHTPMGETRAVLVLHDLTKRKRLQVVRTDFVANASHEMRSPLASILGYAETLGAGTLDEAQARRAVERILHNSLRLDELIRDLIELSRLEHTATHEHGPLDVEERIRDVLASYEEKLEAKRIRLELELESLPHTLQLDGELFRTALSNLCDNAIKYTPEGGRITITSRLSGGGRELEVAVADTGPGIPLEHQARVFERFYRVDTARSRALGGTGLGLAIVKHAMIVLGGQVLLESQPERGSTFRLLLPVRAVTPAPGRSTGGTA